MNTEEPRWWCDVAPGLGEGEGENNLLTRVGSVVGYVIAGIVDEEAGGIVAFAHPDTAERIVTALNRRDVPKMSQYGEALQIARDLNECGKGWELRDVPLNPEYARGQIELLADLFAEPGVFTDDRKLRIQEDLGWIGIV